MSKNIFYEELKKSMQEKEVIAVYLDTENPESFMVCTVSALFSDSAIFSCISRLGEDNGYQASRLNDIFRIERGTRYIKKMERIAVDRRNEFQFNQTADGFRTLLKYALDEKRLVSVSICDDDRYDMTGYIREIEGDKVVLENIDQYGLKDGISIFRISDTMEITCNSIYERNVEKVMSISAE